MPPRRQVLLKTFVAGCGLPCDPAFGAQAMHRREDTTLNDAMLKTAPGHSRRYCHVRSLVRYPQHRTITAGTRAPTKVWDRRLSGHDRMGGRRHAIMACCARLRSRCKESARSEHGSVMWPGLRPFGNAQAITRCGEPIQLSIVGKNFSPKSHRTARYGRLTDCAMMKQCR
jgi:hypothetical protein